MTNTSQQRAFCPFCGIPVRSQARFCSSCGKRFPNIGEVDDQNPPLANQAGRSSTGLIKYAVGGSIVVMVLCIITLGIYLVFGEKIARLLQPETVGLVLDDRGPNGELNGHYNYSADIGGGTVFFSATQEGQATYYLQDSPQDVLSIQLPGGDNVILTWNGITIDGNGLLADTENSMLTALMGGDIAHALAMVPLDLGCQEDSEITDRQLAALLVPLQMRFKYLITDRGAEISRLLQMSVCDYTDTVEGSESERKNSELLNVSLAMPVPVVVGFFPFDAEGSAEVSGLENYATRTALLADCSFKPDTAFVESSFIDFRQVASTSPVLILEDDDDLEHTENEYGPCNSKCRGACGVDCTLKNCEWWEEWRCELDKQTNLTGYKFRWDVYKCGVHTGCIEHDACYDRCNQTYGCGTWRAAHCRHHTSWINLPSPAPTSLLSCDGIAINTYNLKTSLDWARGYGPFEKQAIFEYLDKVRGRELDLELCPAVGTLNVSPQELTDGRLNYPYFFKLEANNLPETVTAVRFSWDFGDEGGQDYPAEGSQYVDAKEGAASLEISHKYEVPGSYIMLVQLLDDTYSRNRLMVEFEVPILINPDQTSVVIDPRTSEGIANQPITFTAQVNNPGDYRYDWIFGDKKVENGGSTVSHTFENPGEYPVKVSLYGLDGLLDEDQGLTIIQPAAEPTLVEVPSPTPGPDLLELIIIPESPVIGEEVQFYLIAENLPDNPSFDWDFGEPYYRSGGYQSYQLWTEVPEATWTYYESGTLMITVLVRDKNNYPVILDTLTWWITVEGKED